MNTRRWLLAAIVIAALAGGGYYYVAASGRARAAQQGPRARDVGLGVIVAIRTLERESDTRLSREQIVKVLPFLKALKDVPTSDTAAIVAIARAVRDAFTPAQQASLEAARREFQQRGAAGGPRGAGSGAPSGEGGEAGARQPRGGGAFPAARGPNGISDEQRDQIRTRTFERMIQYLERRMNS